MELAGQPRIVGPEAIRPLRDDVPAIQRHLDDRPAPEDAGWSDGHPVTALGTRCTLTPS